jgi:hypothetical protein
MGIVQSVPFTTREVGEGESAGLSARVQKGAGSSTPDAARSDD